MLRPEFSGDIALNQSNDEVDLGYRKVGYENEAP